MTEVERAMSYFERGCNCAQAVFAAFGPECGLDVDQCMRVAASFGGGLARRGEICGAVSGALMLLGLKYAQSPIGDPDAKAEAYERAQAFMRVFSEEHGAVICKELLGEDLGTPEGRQRAKERNVAQTHCTRFVRSAAEILARM